MTGPLNRVAFAIDAQGIAWVYHRSFPEERVSVAVADSLKHLAGRLAHGLDYVEPWQRPTLLQAIADLRVEP